MSVSPGSLHLDSDLHYLLNFRKSTTMSKQQSICAAGFSLVHVVWKQIFGSHCAYEVSYLFIKLYQTGGNDWYTRWMCCYSEGSPDWRKGPTRTSCNPKNGSAKSCPWEGIIPCTSTGLGADQLESSCVEKDLGYWQTSWLKVKCSWGNAGQQPPRPFEQVDKLVSAAGD